MWKRLVEQLGEYWGKFMEWARDNPLGLIASFVLAVLVLTVVYWAIWADISPEWTGFGTYDEEANGPRAKTLWDWMDLLLVPAVIAVGGWLLNRTQKSTEFAIAERNRQEEREIAEKNRQEERKIARDKREQETLEAYFDRMAQLMMEGKLKSDDTEEDEASVIARARTLAVLRNLGPERKGNVIQFLYESRLIDSLEIPTPKVILQGANLNGAYLAFAVLEGAWLEGVHLEEATLSGADLRGANLAGAVTRYANLSNAVLSSANLYSAKLGETNLRKADLQDAFLRRAILEFSILKGANLSRAMLVEASLYDTDLTGVMMEGAALQGADLQLANLHGAILNGARYDDDTKWPQGFDPKAAGAILVDEDGSPVEELEDNG